MGKTANFIHGVFMPRSCKQNEYKTEINEKEILGVSNVVIARTINGFKKGVEKTIIDELYKQYNNSKNVLAYTISREKFEEFLAIMLPIYCHSTENIGETNVGSVYKLKMKAGDYILTNLFYQPLCDGTFEITFTPDKKDEE